MSYHEEAEQIQFSIQILGGDHLAGGNNLFEKELQENGLETFNKVPITEELVQAKTNELLMLLKGILITYARNSPLVDFNFSYINTNDVNNIEITIPYEILDEINTMISPKKYVHTPVVSEVISETVSAVSVADIVEDDIFNHLPTKPTPVSEALNILDTL